MTLPKAKGLDRSSSGLERTASAVVIGAIVATVAVTLLVIIAAVNRGFDWTDEGFVYSMIASNRLSTNEFWGFQHLLHPLYEILGSSVLPFRIIRLIGYLMLAAVLALAAHAALRHLGLSLTRKSWLVVILLSQVGTFAAWSYPPRYLGYNELSSWFAQLGGALLILLLITSTDSNTRTAGRMRRLAWLAIGVIIVILFFAKVTAALVLGVLVVPVVLLTVRSWELLVTVAALVGGVAVAVVVLLATGVPLVGYAQTIIELVLNPAAQSASGYSIGALLVTYMSSAALTIRELALPIVLATLILLVGRGTHRSSTVSANQARTATFEGLAPAGIAVLALLLLLPSANVPWNAIGSANTFVFFLAIVAFSLLYARRTKSPGQYPTATKVGYALFLFAATPFINALGTNNAIFGQTLFSVTIWAVGTGVVLCLLWERTTARSWFARLTPLLIVAIVVAGSGLAVARDVFVEPYRTHPYFKQTTPVTAGALAGLKLSKDQAELFEWLREAGIQYQAEGTPTLSIASSGALLAFNLSDWANLWPGPDWADSIERACDRLPPNHLYVLKSDSETKGSPGYDKLVAGLKRCGIDFPRDFEEVDSHTSDDPYWSVTIWERSASDS